MDLTIFVVDDDDAARDSLVFLLRTEGLTSRGYPSAASFLNQLLPDQQGCIITDVRMPEMDGLTMVQVLNERGNRMPIIVITGHADVPLAVQAMKAGVADFIEKPFESDTILRSLRQCIEAVHASSATASRRAEIERRKATLTERESQVLAHLADGLSNKDIGQTLGISPRTVEIHRANVMSKMRAESLSDLVRFSIGANAA